MKKLVVIITAILFMAGYTASAQMMSHGTQQHQGMMGQNSGVMPGNSYGGMMNSGMHNGNYGGMMNSGMHGGMMNGMMGMMQNGNCSGYGQIMNANTSIENFSFLIYRLPKLQQQLSLDNNQVEKLFSLQTEFRKQQIDFQSDLRREQLELNNLVQETASNNQVKKQLEAIATTRIDQKVAAYETANKMKAVLTDEQKEKLNDTGQISMMNNDWTQQCLNGFENNQND